MANLNDGSHPPTSQGEAGKAREWTPIHDQLAYAYVLGWYAGSDGITNDSGKINAAHELYAKLLTVNQHDALKAERDQLKAALEGLLNAVAPKGRYRAEEIEPYFKEPMRIARAALSLAKGGGEKHDA